MNPKTSSAWAIETHHLSKRMGNVSALRDIDLQIPYREFVTIIGPNGAGKTTLMRILATLLRPTSGQVCVAGLAALDAEVEIRRRIGFVSHQTLLYGDLTGRENLRFYARLYEVSHQEDRTTQLLDRVGMSEWCDVRVHTLSRGMQQRLSLARALLHNPSIVLLDEPYTGLDQHAADALSDLLGGLVAEEHTVLMTTHDWIRGAELADRVLVLDRGRISHESCARGRSPQELQRLYNAYATGIQSRRSEARP